MGRRVRGNRPTRPLAGSWPCQRLARARTRRDPLRDERAVRGRLSPPELGGVDRQPVRLARVLGPALGGDPVHAVLLHVDVDAERLEGLPVGPPLERLGVREGAVEVEQDAADHVSVHDLNVA